MSNFLHTLCLPPDQARFEDHYQETGSDAEDQEVDQEVVDR